MSKAKPKPKTPTGYPPPGVLLIPVGRTAEGVPRRPNVVIIKRRSK